MTKPSNRPGKLRARKRAVPGSQRAQRRAFKDCRTPGCLESELADADARTILCSCCTLAQASRGSAP